MTKIVKIQIYAIGQFSIVVNGQTLKNTQTSHLVTLSIEDNKDKGIISMVGSKFHDFYVDQKCPPTWIVCDQMCVDQMHVFIKCAQFFANILVWHAVWLTEMSVKLWSSKVGSFFKILKLPILQINKHSITKGSDSGSVGIVVTSNTRDPWFVSSHRQIIFTINCFKSALNRRK